MHRALLLLTLAFLTACADQGEFPSLARRPVETASLAPASPPPVPPADAALAKRLADARATVEAGKSAFDSALPAARIAVEAAGPSGSESWIAAQLELSRLEATLEPARAALSLLDSERRSIVSGGNAADLEVLETAIVEIEAIDAQQSKAVSELTAALSR